MTSLRPHLARTGQHKPQLSRVRRNARWVAVVLAVSCGLAACSDPDPTVVAVTPSVANTEVAALNATIVTNGTEPQSTLLPTDSNDSGGGRVVDQLFAGLVSYGADGRLRYEVAQSITSTDNVSWNIELRPGQKFTDDSAVTAASFVDAWNFGALATNRQGNSSYFSVIAGYGAVAPAVGNPTADRLSGLEVTGDLTFTVRLERAMPNFPVMLGYRAFFPLPKVAFQDLKAFGEAPVGNGPYQLKSSSAWQHDQQIQLVKNPDYMGARKPRNGGITFVLYQDANLAYADVKAGNLDVLSEVPPEQVQSFQNDLGARALTASGAGATQLMIPQTMPQFGMDAEGKLRRRAVSLAINRSAVCDAGVTRICEPAVDFTSYTLASFDPAHGGAAALAFNVAEAKRLWAQADAIRPYSGVLKVAYNSDDPMTQAWALAVVSALQQSLQVDAKAAPYESLAQLRNNIEQRYLDAAVVTRVTPAYPAALAYLQPLFASEAGGGFGANDGDYESPDFDAALHQAAASEPMGPAILPQPGDVRASLSPEPTEPESTPGSSSAVMSSAVTSTESTPSDSLPSGTDSASPQTARAQAPSAGAPGTDLSTGTTSAGTPSTGTARAGTPSPGAAGAPGAVGPTAGADTGGTSTAAPTQTTPAQDLAAVQSVLLKDLPAIPLSNDNVMAAFSDAVLPTAFGWDGLPAYFNLVKVLPAYSPTDAADSSQAN